MKHYYTDHNIFGMENWFNFHACYQDAVLRAPADRESKFVEVGAFRGRSTAYMGVEIINSEKPITLYVVDTFEGSAEHQGIIIDLANLAHQFRDNLQPVADVLGDRFQVYHGKSLDASKAFADGSIDFVFLDGSHEYDDVVADIKAWYPKVKASGMIAGDDWRWPSVQAAVRNEFGRNVVVSHHESLQYPWWHHSKPYHL